MHARMCASMYPCICTRAHAQQPNLIHIDVYSCTYGQTHIHAFCLHTYIHATYLFSFFAAFKHLVCTYIHTYIHTHKHTDKHTYIHTNIHTNNHTCVHMCICINARIRLCLETYTCTREITQAKHDTHRYEAKTFPSGNKYEVRIRTHTHTHTHIHTHTSKNIPERQQVRGEHTHTHTPTHTHTHAHTRTYTHTHTHTHTQTYTHAVTTSGHV